MTKALLLGTNHFDTEGGEKIQTALKRFTPNHILVENSRYSHKVNLAAKQTALKVIEKYSVSDAIKQLIVFEREGLLRDIEAVDAFAKAHPDVNIDFFKDDQVKSMKKAIKEIRQMATGILEKIKPLPPQVQVRIAREQIAQLTQMLLMMKSDWEIHGDRITETHLAEAFRRTTGSIKLDERDEKMWSVLEALQASDPESRIATITGAAHIMRTMHKTSLFDKIEASEKFEATRDMLCFK